MVLTHRRTAHLSSLIAWILFAAWIAAVVASHGPLTTLTSPNHPERGAAAVSAFTLHRDQYVNPAPKQQQQPRSPLSATGQPSASLQDIQLTTETDLGPGDIQLTETDVGPGDIQLTETDAGPGDKAVKPLLPLDGIDFAVLGIIIFSLSLAGGAGIGGGAILVPVYLMLRGWPTAVAVALSNVTILGGSFANFICNVRRHRPNGKRTIDWELILMMEPTTIAGALVGAVANKLLPNWIITYLLAILLTLMGLRLFTKGKQAYAKETQLLLAAKAAAKERQLERHRGASLSRRSAVLDALEPAGPEETAALTSSSQGVAVPRARTMKRGGSFNRAFSQSFSRLRGSLVVGFEQPSQQGDIVSTAGSLLSPAAGGLLHAQGADLWSPADAAAAGGGGNDQQLPAPALEQYVRSTLFQGDAGDTGVVVALPASDDMSPVSSAASEDLEEGGAAADDTAELHRPLLSDDQDGSGLDDLQRSDQFRGGDLRHASAAEADAGAKWGSKSASLRGFPSPDMTVQVGPIASPAKLSAPEPSLPLPHFFTLLGLSAWVVAADITQDSFRCGSLPYWATQLSILVPVLAILAVFRHKLLRKYRHDELPAGTQLPDGELHWTKRTTFLYPLLCSTAGLIAGLFGIGGGVVKGPLMLELGVPADVAAATSATMIMFTAGSACLVYSRFGHILYDYAAVLLVLGFLITLCSQLLTFLLIKLLGRRSIIVFMMVALMGAATGIMYVQSWMVTADLIHHPEDLWRFGSICPSTERGNLLKRLGSALLSQLH